MTWQFTDQVQTYARRTWPLLAAAPARNTIALTVIENVLAGHRWSSEAMTFGWFTAGELAVGAICMTPPYELLLAEVPASAIEPLADALLARGTAVTGVNGEAADAKAFAAAWTARRPARAVSRRQERLYQLGTLLPARPGSRSPTPRPHCGSADSRRLVHPLSNRSRRPPRRRRTDGPRPGRQPSPLAVGGRRRPTGLHSRPEQDRSRGGPRRSGLHTDRAPALRVRSCRHRGLHQGCTRAGRATRRALHRPIQSHVQRDLPADRLPPTTRSPGHRLRGALSCPQPCPGSDSRPWRSKTCRPVPGGQQRSSTTRRGGGRML